MKNHVLLAVATDAARLFKTQNSGQPLSRSRRIPPLRRAALPRWLTALGTIALLAQALQGQTWPGTDDFSSGISTNKWTLYQNWKGQMTVTGANNHASFLVPTTTATEQAAKLLWKGQPPVTDDWQLEIAGHNEASWSANGSSQLQFGIYNTATLPSQGYGFSMARGRSGSSIPQIRVDSTAGARTNTTVINTNFAMRLIYRSSTKVIEAWYDPSAGGAWVRLDTINLDAFAPGMSGNPANTFTIAVEVDCYYGPITEGQLYVDNFSLSNSTPVGPIPAIVSQPASRANDVGSTATFTVSAACTAPLAYQWRFNGTNLANGGNVSGALTSALTLTNVQTDQAGAYSAVVSSAYGSVTSSVAVLTVGPYSYTTHNGTVTIDRYIGSGAVVTIPASINGQPVTSIRDGAFSSCTSLIRITIPDSVTTIGVDAFFGCSNLMTATIGGGVTSVGNYAFASCTSLASVYFRGDAPAAGPWVFSGATNATVYYLPVRTGWAKYFSGRPSVLFQYDFTADNATITITRWYADPQISWQSVTIPAAIDGLPVTSIGVGAFAQNQSLGTVTIPNGVTDIGDAAFASCGALNSVTIPDSVTSIGNGAFSGGYRLSSITIPNSVTNIGYNAFGNSYLGTVTFLDSATSIGDHAFSGCSGLWSVMLGSRVSSIGHGTFDGCSRLGSITIPNSVTSIGDDAFGNCASLTSVTIPNSVAFIGTNVFSYCIRLTSIAVDPLNGFYSSAAGVLFNKRQSTLLRCPEGKDGSYTIPNSVISVGDGAFENCTLTTSVTIPNSVTNIGTCAFYGCTILTNVTISNGVNSIGESAFSSCRSLSSVTLGSGVKTIPRGAFGSCSSLSNITIPNSVTSVGDRAFDYCIRLSSVTLPNSVTNIGGGAFSSCTSLSSVTLGSGVTSIGNFAFYNCTNLQSAYFLGSAPTLGGGAVFYPDDNATVYYLPGTTGWGPTFGDRPTQLWYLYPVAPAITAHPQSQIVSSGGAASFEVGASGGFLSYQWRCNGTNLVNGGAFAGTTTTNVVIASVQPSHAGNYSVVVTNAAGSATSSVAVLTLFPPAPNITSQPASRTNLAGTAVTFTVAATGTAPLAHQWRYNGTNLANGGVFSGVTTTNLTIGSLQANHAGYYSVVVTNAAGSATSSVAVLTVVIVPPTISSQPVSRTNVVGTTPTFTVVVTGSPPLAYQWRFNGANLANGGSISGVTSTNLSIGSVQTNHAGSYSVVVTNSGGCATSSVAVLTVIPPPSLALALSDPALAWTTGGTVPWFPQSITTHDGVAAAQSGIITHNQESWMQTSLAGPGVLTYWWKVSSEFGYDNLGFYLDGVLQSGGISGGVDWQKKTNSIAAGAHTVKWRYVKDGSASVGQDAGWVDQVSYTGTASLRFETANGSLSVSNGLCNLRLTGTAGASVVMERSSGLTTWTPFQTNTLPAGGLTLAIPTANHPQQFFRARQVTTLP